MSRLMPEPSLLTLPHEDRAESSGRNRAVSLVALWIRRQRSRRHLAGLSPRLLRDIGLSEEAVRQETAKPFWR